MLGTPIYQIVNNAYARHVSFNEAINQYKKGKTIECRILNTKGEIIDWERYHIAEGLEIAVEFNEVLNGMWLVIES